MGRWRAPLAALAVVVLATALAAEAADKTVPMIAADNSSVPVKYHDNGDGTYSVTTYGGASGATNLYADNGAATPIALQAGTVVDNKAAPSAALQTASFGLGHDGTTWDVLRTGSAANIGATSGTGALAVAPPGNWSIFQIPSTATQATISRGAGGAGVRHVLTSATWTISCVGTAQTAPINAVVRDGASGAGTVVFATTLNCPINDTRSFSISPLNIVGTANTAMTVEFSGAGAAASQQSVSATGYDAG